MGEPAIAGRFVVSDALAQRSNQVRQLTFVPQPGMPRNKAILLRPCEDLPKAAAIAGFVRETHRSLERHSGRIRRGLEAAGGRELEVPQAVVSPLAQLRALKLAA